jgi:hypothetical protein
MSGAIRSFGSATTKLTGGALKGVGVTTVKAGDDIAGAVVSGKNVSKTSGALGWISKHKKPIAAWTAGGVGAGLLVSPIGGNITDNVGNSIGGLFGGLMNGFGAAGLLPFSSCAVSSCVIVIVILMLALGD